MHCTRMCKPTGLLSSVYLLLHSMEVDKLIRCKQKPNPMKRDNVEKYENKSESTMGASNDVIKSRFPLDCSLNLLSLTAWTLRRYGVTSTTGTGTTLNVISLTDLKLITQTQKVNVCHTHTHYPFSSLYLYPHRPHRGRENWKLIPTHLTLHCSRAPPAMASLPSILAEILVLIFTYLQCFADLTSIAGVCKDWRNAVHVPTSTWNKQIQEHPIDLRTDIRLISYKSACEVSLLCSLFLKSTRAFLVPRLRWMSPIFSVQITSAPSLTAFSVTSSPSFPPRTLVVSQR
jgi:hypothetical protein